MAKGNDERNNPKRRPKHYKDFPGYPRRVDPNSPNQKPGGDTYEDHNPKKDSPNKPSEDY
jgi:hypothetical protein